MNNIRYLIKNAINYLHCRLSEHKITDKNYIDLFNPYEKINELKVYCARCGHPLIMRKGPYNTYYMIELC
jgi:hypothetical protein